MKRFILAFSLLLSLVPAQAAPLLFLTPLRWLSGLSNLHSGSFNGTSSQVDLGASAFNWNYTQAFTLNIYIKNLVAIPGAAQYIFNTRNRNSSYSGWALGIDNSGNGGNIFFGLFGTTGTAKITFTPPSSSSWASMTVVSDGTGTVAGIHAYINGSAVTPLSTTDSYSGSMNTGGEEYIGTLDPTDGGYASFLNDEDSVWNTNLNSTTVSSYFSSHPINLAGKSGLVSWYRFENTVLSPADSSSTIYDRAGSNNGTNNSVTFSTDVP